jgi:hypothetical protein
MADTSVFQPGSYRYIKGPFQYSGGVAAQPGFRIERARFAQVVPMEKGFRAIEAHLSELDRPLTSFCACELRSSAPFTEAGFIAFNRIYVGTLARWGIYRDGDNPVARSNVCPESNPPAEPGFHAFSYTVPEQPDTATRRVQDFVISGSAEAPEGSASYAAHIIRRGDTSSEAMREKARYVLGAMESRMESLGANWAAASAIQVYTVHDLHPFLADEIVARNPSSTGLTWHYARPPVEDLDYEMDVRGVALERLI